MLIDLQINNSFFSLDHRDSNIYKQIYKYTKVAIELDYSYF